MGVLVMARVSNKFLIAHIKGIAHIYKFHHQQVPNDTTDVTFGAMSQAKKLGLGAYQNFLISSENGREN